MVPDNGLSYPIESKPPYNLCIKDLAVIPRNFLPQNQKMIPQQLKKVIKAMLVSMGGSKPLAIDQGVRNLLTPYPHRFLLLQATVSGNLRKQEFKYRPWQPIALTW